MPLTLLNLKGEYDVFVLEMGMGDHGNLTRLTSIAPPDVAVLTKIAPAGLKDFAGGLEAVARAKSEIFSQKKTRLGILSAQAAGFGSALYGGGCQKWIYGLKKDVADAREVDFVLDASGRINDSPPMEFPFAAEHLKENVVAAAAVARAFGLSWEEIASGVKKCRPFEKRFEMVNRDGVTFVNDSYNANPHSMVAALANLPEPKEGGRRIAVLGPMADLGNSSLHYHKQVGNFAMEKVDALVCVGREAKSYGKAIHVEKNQEAKELLRSMIRPGDVVLVKGSNAGKLWEVLE
jgi:UDP-N-acetylmuramoyl-tripeptide--D-alanyl-D-alanine ligase